jgi:AcrR family transcriptional regulator
MAATKTKPKAKFRRLPGSRPDQIMDAAEEVFGKYGYQAANLDAIARNAGITKGTIYLYFKSKKELFLRTMQRRALSILKGAKANIGVNDSFEGFLSGTLPMLRGFFRDPAYPNFLRLMLAESGRFPNIGKEFLREIILRGMSIGSASYAADVARGKFKDLDPGIVMRCLIGMHVVFIITQDVLGGREFDPLDWNEITRTIDTIFRDGVKRRE